MHHFFGGRGGRGVLRRSREDEIYLKFGHLKNLDFFLDRQTDRQTDHQTEIVVHREVTLPKILNKI